MVNWLKENVDPSGLDHFFHFSQAFDLGYDIFSPSGLNTEGFSVLMNFPLLRPEGLKISQPRSEGASAPGGLGNYSKQKEARRVGIFSLCLYVKLSA